MKTIAATEFKAKCLNLIGQIVKDREPVTITKHGQPVAILSPLPQTNQIASIVGSMRDSVLEYSKPFQPATKSSDWSASQ